MWGIRLPVVLIFFLFACQSKQDMSNKSRLMAQLPKDPAAAITMVDSLLLQNASVKASDRRVLELRNVRQHYFVMLADMDSVLEEAIRIQQIARRLDDSVAFAAALLPLRGTMDEAKFKYLEDSYPLSIGIFSRRNLYPEQATLQANYAAMLGNLGLFPNPNGRR